MGIPAPLEVLEEELKRCPADEEIVLDFTELWHHVGSRVLPTDQPLRDAAAAFARLLDGLTGDEGRDRAELDRLVNVFGLSVAPFSVADLPAMERWFSGIGLDPSPQRGGMLPDCQGYSSDTTIE